MEEEGAPGIIFRRNDQETISISDYIVTVKVTEKSLVFSKI